MTMVVPFTPRMLTDVQQVMWEAYCSGLEMDVAGKMVGVCRKSVYNRVAEAGGIRPRRGRNQVGRGDVTRFATSAKLARYTGCAPIPVYSSDKERHRHRLHREGNRRLNSVLYTAAIVQKRHDPAARNLLDRHETAKGTRGARRILQRHLVDVIHKAMQADQATWTHQITRYPAVA